MVDIREPQHCAGCVGTDYIGRPCLGRISPFINAHESIREIALAIANDDITKHRGMISAQNYGELRDRLAAFDRLDRELSR